MNRENGIFKHEKSYSRRSRLGWFEKLMLKALGRKDGRNDLPSPDETGRWMSSTIQKELNSCCEAHNMVYRSLYEHLDDKYKEAGLLTDKLERLSVNMTGLQQAIPEPPTELDLSERKYGEEKLSESQIRERRRREYERSIEGILSKISDLQSEIDTKIDELLEIKNYLVEKQEEAELLCEKLKCHTMQRIDYYWSAAKYAACKKQRMIPPAYYPAEIPDVVANYKDKHEEEVSRINDVVAKFGKDQLEVA